MVVCLLIFILEASVDRTLVGLEYACAVCEGLAMKYH